MTTIRRRAGTVLCALAAILWCMAGLLSIASADEAEGSLTLWCVKDDDIVVGMHWQLYRVGHREANDYVFEGAFADCRATLGDRTKPMLEWDSDTVAAAGETLKLRTITDKIPSRDSGKTDSAGSLTFGGLEDGLYLVWGDVLDLGEVTYFPGAIFFEMNGEDAAVLNAYPKIVLARLSGRTYNYSVRKVWLNDENQPQDRSVFITADIYMDNEFYQEVTLNEENNWTFEWNGTDDHIWFAVEKVIPANYTVAYRSNFTQYLIVNTYEDDSADESTETVTATSTTEQTNDKFSDTQTDDQTETTASGTGDTGADTTGTTSATTPPPPESSVTSTTDGIPQTGQLWWPVPVLAAGGLLLLGVGLLLRKEGNP